MTIEKIYRCQFCDNKAESVLTIRDIVVEGIDYYEMELDRVNLEWFMCSFHYKRIQEVLMKENATKTNATTK